MIDLAVEFLDSRPGVDASQFKDEYVIALVFFETFMAKVSRGGRAAARPRIGPSSGFGSATSSTASKEQPAPLQALF
jgi:hypothetical protein